jgi:hypothetical protein
MVFASGLNLVLLTVIGLYLLNDDDYREILIWSADYFLDGRLDIDGAFSVRIGHEVELTAEGVRLKAYDGSYDLSVARLNVEQRFGSYLTSGTLWINHLNMEDLQGDIRDTGGEEEFDWQAFSLPFVVIEEIQLNKLSLAYTEFDQQRHTIELSYISLDDTDNKGPVIVSIAGEINERPLRLEGTLGSLKQLRSGNQTYPVDLILSNDNGSNRQVIELDGTVGHTPSGSSQVDAIFDVNIPELVPIFERVAAGVSGKPSSPQPVPMRINCVSAVPSRIQVNLNCTVNSGCPTRQVSVPVLASISAGMQRLKVRV